MYKKWLGSISTCTQKYFPMGIPQAGKCGETIATSGNKEAHSAKSFGARD